MKKVIQLFVLATLIWSCGTDGYSNGEILFLRNQGCDMPVHIYGKTSSKIFVVVLHGGPGGNGLEYRSGKYAELLEEEVAMAYWDQRGQGNSRGNKHHSTLDLDLLNDDLDKLVQLLKHQYGDDINLFLFGHSWGGTYGTKYLMSAERQKHFSGWIEADGAHDIPLLNKEAIKAFITIGEDRIAQGSKTSEWQEIVDFAKGVDTTTVISNDIGSEINSNAYKAEELIDEIAADNGGFQVSMFNSPYDPVSSTLSGNYTSAELDRNGIEDIALTDSLYQLTLPCLFLWGKYDFVVPPRLGTEAARLASSTDKEFILYEQSGHSPMSSEAEAFATDMLEFMHRNAR